MRARDLLQDLDLGQDEVTGLLELAAEVKRWPRRWAGALEGRYIALLFEKPSLRTRLTFQLAIKQLGGDFVAGDGEIGEREPLKDVARNLDRWVDAIVVRAHRQATIEDLARWSAKPVINALSDLYHPCQALADMLTLGERLGNLAGVKLAFIGDGNNVAHSLMLTAARLGMDFRLAAPEGFAPNPEITAQAGRLASAGAGGLKISNDPREAALGAQAIYTDVWTSMGQESEAERRRQAFRNFQVNEELFELASPGAFFLHCLPARRGEEVTEAVIDSSRSLAFEQAENRIHAQKALLLMLLG